MDYRVDSRYPITCGKEIAGNILMPIHPMDRAAQLFTDLENALDDAWSMADTAEQEAFCMQLLTKVQLLSGELAYESREPEDYDSYVANREERG